jgi:hypothetical protein
MISSTTTLRLGVFTFDSAGKLTKAQKIMMESIETTSIKVVAGREYFFFILYSSI